MASGLLLHIIFELFIYLSNLSTATNYEWREIYAKDGASSDQFGYSVGISGCYAIVGAPNNDDLGSNSGAAYIFIQDSVTGNWTQSQKLLASDGAANDYFGRSVSISGNVSIVGAYGDDDMGSNAGAAYIFTKDETTGNFSQTIKLLPNDTSAKYCGFSVSISGDSAIMGCYYSSTSRAYIFEYDEIEDEWQQSAMFTGSGYFGYSVAIYDSTYAIVGAYLDDDESTNAGAAFIYTKNELTSGWGYTQSIYASDASSNDYFGEAVDICKHYAIIGASRDDDYGSSSGAAYIFYRNSNTWNQTQKLAPSDLDYADYFGASVSLNCDSKQNYYAIVGAYLDDDKGTNAGAAYLFTLETLDFDEDYWNDTAKLTASDGSSNDYFGFSVCASGDNVIIGSRYNDNKASNAGSAYIVGGVSSFYNGSIIVECNDELECADEEEIDCDIIYCRGYESCKNSIMNVSDDCYCTGDNACVQSEIFSSNVECNGFLSCNETIIESNKTECNGYYGCIDSIISSTSLLKSSSYRSCENCSISNTPNIYAYGELSFFNAQISTDGVNNFNLLSRGVHALKDASLYCYSGSTCVVKCGNGPTCSGLNYYCDSGANCRLNCNETCSTCPDIIDGIFISALLGNSKETLVVNKKEKEKETEVEYFAINSNSNSNHYSDGKNQIYVLTIYAIITTIYIIKRKFVKMIDNNHDSNYSYSVISDP